MGETSSPTTRIDPVLPRKSTSRHPREKGCEGRDSSGAGHGVVFSSQPSSPLPLRKGSVTFRRRLLAEWNLESSRVDPVPDVVRGGDSRPFLRFCSVRER